MSEQPTALRLAEILEHPGVWLNVEQNASAELRRLYAVNQELLKALKVLGAHAGNCDYLMLLTSLPPQRKPCSCGLHAAIARAEGEES